MALIESRTGTRGPEQPPHLDAREIRNAAGTTCYGYDHRSRPKDDPHSFTQSLFFSPSHSNFSSSTAAYAEANQWRTKRKTKNYETKFPKKLRYLLVFLQITEPGKRPVAKLARIWCRRIISISIDTALGVDFRFRWKARWRWCRARRGGFATSRICSTVFAVPGRTSGSQCIWKKKKKNWINKCKMVKSSLVLSATFARPVVIDLTNSRGSFSSLE